MNILLTDDLDLKCSPLTSKETEPVVILKNFKQCNVLVKKPALTAVCGSELPGRLPALALNDTVPAVHVPVPHREHHLELCLHPRHI